MRGVLKRAALAVGFLILLTQIAWAMYRQARPNADIPAQDRALEKASAL